MLQFTHPFHTAPSSPIPTKDSFSLDFPPGLVDIDAKGDTSSQSWNSIKKILKTGAQTSRVTNR